MTRAPADVVDPQAAALYATGAAGSSITTDTLRSWAHRGHVKRYTRGYSLADIDSWLSRRNARMVRPGRTVDVSTDSV